MPRRIPVHRPAHLARQDEARRRAYERGASRQADKAFYKSPAWRRLREQVIREQPLCAECRRHGRLTPTEHVHHIKERKARPDLALDRTNLEGLCESCHSRLASWGRSADSP